MTGQDAAQRAAKAAVEEWECGCCPECEQKMCEHSIGFLATVIDAAVAEAKAEIMRLHREHDNYVLAEGERVSEARRAERAQAEQRPCCHKEEMINEQARRAEQAEQRVAGLEAARRNAIRLQQLWHLVSRTGYELLEGQELLEHLVAALTPPTP